jgi:hypothetical protein
MSRFLEDVHIVELLNELVGDSGSERDVSETEYSPRYGYYNILMLIIVFKYMSKMPVFLDPSKR